ncbi:MAG: GNAT family N-acetyltransferase [Candidatus Methanomethylophilaceae archaeon]
MDNLPFNTKGYRLLKAAGDDKPFLLSCVKESILASVSKEEAEMQGLWINDILGITSTNLDSDMMENEAFILTDGNGKNVGILWMGKSKDQFTCDDIGYLLGIFVEKRLRGRGLGRSLLEAAETWCRNKGLMSMTMNVGSANEKAIALYESSGYVPQTMVMKRQLF